MNKIETATNTVSSWHQITDWVFDLDNTLYPASCNLFGQVEQRIRDFIAAHLRLAASDAVALQKKYFRQYGTSLRGLMVEHGVNPQDYLDYVHRIDLDAVQSNPDLDNALSRLPGRKSIFTNGSVAHAHRVLDRLGVGYHFTDIFDIAAADFIPKPAPETYRRMSAQLVIDPQRAAMVEDLPQNLHPAAALGMTTILVHHDGDQWRHEHENAGQDHIHHVTDDLARFLHHVSDSIAQ